MIHDTQFESHYVSARAAWPHIDVPREAFEAWIGERVPLGEHQSRTDELYLCCACARGDSRAIRAFEKRYYPAAQFSLSRFGVDVDDVIQELGERLFVGGPQRAPKIAEYSGRGGLDRWVRAVAVRLAMNLKRAKKNQAQASLEDDAFLIGEDPELVHIKKVCQSEFKRAFGEALSVLAPEFQRFLRLYYLDGLGLSALAQLFGVSEATASRRIAAGRKELLEMTRAKLQTHLDLDESELASMMRMIWSKLSMEVNNVAVP